MCCQLCSVSPLTLLPARGPSLQRGVAKLSLPSPVWQRRPEHRHSGALKSPKVALLSEFACSFQELWLQDPCEAVWQRSWACQRRNVRLVTSSPLTPAQTSPQSNSKGKKKNQHCSYCSTAWQPGATGGVLQEVSTLHPQTDLRALTNGQALISAIFLTASQEHKRKWHRKIYPEKSRRLS